MNAAVVVKDGGKYFFVQGSVRFECDSDPKQGIVRTLDQLDKLQANQLVELATLNQFPVDPFNKKLLRPVLMGVVQSAWYAGVLGKCPDKVAANQVSRVEAYVKQLEDFKNKPQAVVDVVDRVSRTRRSSGTTSTGGAARQAKAYRLSLASKDKWDKFAEGKGQKGAIVRIMKQLGAVGPDGPGATVDSIASASQGAMETGTDPKRIVHFYINQFQHGDIVEVVGEQAKIPTQQAEKPAEEKPAPAPDKKKAAKKGK
jgi:hypothetical protein